MSKISDLRDLEESRSAELWSLLEPMVQAAITHRLHQFHDALVSRDQIPAGSNPAGDCVAVEATGLEQQVERAGCSTAADTPESGLFPQPCAKLH